MTTKNSLIFPPLPDKRFFTIGETATLTLSKPHILRYWEKQFGKLLSDIKKNGNRRYYTRDNILLLRKIQSMRLEQGLTIAGVRTALSKNEPVDSNTKKIQSIIAEINNIINSL